MEEINLTDIVQNQSRPPSEIDNIVKQVQSKTDIKKEANLGYDFSGDLFLGTGLKEAVTKPSLSFTNTNVEDAFVNIGGDWISKNPTYKRGRDNNEYNAQKQTLTEKWGNGLAKFGIKTGTAVIGGTVGIVDSLITGISEGSISEGYNSSLNKTLDKVNEYVDYKLPNLVTEQEKNASLLGQMGYANFYADKVLGGLSFMTGAIISESIWSAATAATFGAAGGGLAATTARNAEKLGVWGEKAGVWGAKALGGEANVLKVLNKAKEITKSPLTGMLDDLALKQISNVGKNFAIKGYQIGKGLDIIIPMARSAAYESGMESRLFMKQTEEEWLDKYREQNGGASPSSEEYATFKDGLSSTANGVFAGNMALLSVSNYLQFGKAMQGATTARTVTNNAFGKKFMGFGFKEAENGAKEIIKATKAQKIFGRVYGLGEGFVTEGIWEEMGQSVVSGTGENFMMAGFDKDKSNSNYGLMDAFGDSLKKTYSTKEGWTEGLIGGIIGVMGGVGGGIKNKMSKDSKGERLNFFDIDNERADLQDTIDYSNGLTTAMHLNNVKAANKMAFSQELENSAIRNNDISGQELAKTSFTLSLLERNIAIGGLESGIKEFNLQVKNLDNKALMEEMGFENEEQAMQYKEQVILEHKEIADAYTKNLKYAETLIGQKDFQGREDLQEFLKGQSIVGSGVQEIQRAMAMTLTMGEKSKQIYRNNTEAILEEVAISVGNEAVPSAVKVSKVLSTLSENKKNEISKLKNKGVNLKNRLATQNASLVKAGKIKVGEDASERTNRFLDINEQIAQTNLEIQENENQKQMLVEALNISQGDSEAITVEMLDNHEKNVAEFSRTMSEIKGNDPQKYNKIVGLLSQQEKALKHIKNYEKSSKAITNQETRLKTVGGWINSLFTKNAKLKEGQKSHFRDILVEYSNQGAILKQNTEETKENREAFSKEGIDKVSQKYLDKLNAQDYNSLLKEDKAIIDASKEQEVKMEMPDQVKELEKERDEKIAELEKTKTVLSTTQNEIEAKKAEREEELHNLGRKLLEKRFEELKIASSGKELANTVFNIEKSINSGATLTNEEQSFLDKKKQELKDKGFEIISPDNKIHDRGDKFIIESSKNLKDGENLTKEQIKAVEEKLIRDEKRRNKLKAQGLSNEEIEKYFEKNITIMEAITPQINENDVMVQSSKVNVIVIDKSEIYEVLNRSKQNPRNDKKTRLDKINAKYDSELADLNKTKTGVSTDNSAEVNKKIETIKAEYNKKINEIKPQNKTDQIQSLKDKVQELTSHDYYLNYFGESFEQKQRDKPSQEDVKEYEELLAKWNRSAETKLTRILARPSDYKYKQDIGLTPKEIDRLKELNKTLGEWMTLQGTSAGNGESVADLMERISSLEAKLIKDNTKIKLDVQEDFPKIVEISEEELIAGKNTDQRGGATPVQALITPTPDRTAFVISHASPKLISTWFNDVNDVSEINENGDVSITFSDGQSVTLIRNTSRGNYKITKEDWDKSSERRNILTVNFGTMSTAINQSKGLDSQGEEQFAIVDGDATYLQTDGTNLVIDQDAVNGTQNGDVIELRVSTFDKYNSELKDGIVKDSKFQIYMFRNNKFIGAVPANRLSFDETTGEEQPDGLGLPLLQLRKNAIEYVERKVAQGESGIIKLPYTLESTMTFIGQPNLTLKKDESGNPTTKQNIFTEKSLQLVVGTGYIQDGVIESTIDVQVAQFINKLSKSNLNKGKKIPFIIFDYNGKTVAFPVDLTEENNPQDTILREMFAAPKQGASPISNNLKIKTLIETLTENGIDPQSFGLNYTDSENFANQTTEIENALDALSQIKKSVSVTDFAKKTYKIENLQKDATIAIQLDNVPFLSSKLMIKLSDKITDVSVPLEVQKEDLKEQERVAINKIANIGEQLIIDYNDKDTMQFYVDDKGNGLYGVYDTAMDGKDKTIDSTTDIGRRGIVNIVRKATGSKSNEESVNREIEQVKKEYSKKLNEPQVEKRVIPYTELGQLKGIPSNNQISMTQGSENNTITLLIDADVKKEYSQKLKQHKDRFNNKGGNFKHILKDIAKKYRSSYGKDIILDLRGIDLNQIEDNIIFDLENPKQNAQENLEKIIKERDDKIAILRDSIKVTDLKNIDGEIIVKVPKIVEQRISKGVFKNLELEIRNLDKIRAKKDAITIEIKDRLKKQASDVKIGC